MSDFHFLFYILLRARVAPGALDLTRAMTDSQATGGKRRVKPQQPDIRPAYRANGPGEIGGEGDGGVLAQHGFDHIATQSGMGV